MKNKDQGEGFEARVAKGCILSQTFYRIPETCRALAMFSRGANVHMRTNDHIHVVNHF